MLVVVLTVFLICYNNMLYLPGWPHIPIAKNNPGTQELTALVSVIGCSRSDKLDPANSG